MGCGDEKRGEEFSLRAVHRETSAGEAPVRMWGGGGWGPVHATPKEAQHGKHGWAVANKPLERHSSHWSLAASEAATSSAVCGPCWGLPELQQLLHLDPSLLPPTECHTAPSALIHRHLVAHPFLLLQTNRLWAKQPEHHTAQSTRHTCQRHHHGQHFLKSCWRNIHLSQRVAFGSVIPSRHHHCARQQSGNHMAPHNPPKPPPCFNPERGGGLAYPDMPSDTTSSADLK